MTKITRKELLKKDDAFLAAAKGGARWIGTHRGQVVLAVIAAAAVILSTWGVVQYIAERDSEASWLFAKALATLEGTVGEASPALDDDRPARPHFASDQEKWAAARAQFQEVIDRAGTSGVSKLALFYAADLDEKLGKQEEAMQAFLRLVGELSPRDSLLFLAVERAALLQEAKGDVDAALNTLARLSNVEGSFYRDMATYHQARLYLAKGEVERARNLFTHIEKEFPNSSVIEKVREQLAALGEAKSDAMAPPMAESKTP
ncbi:MAG: tetratricopeptide repeat protein [Deltaproteobacteria bacterium]|nr:tetratricopeptide repeat protein [Deltaproteobacteria bacterium]